MALPFLSLRVPSQIGYCGRQATVAPRLRRSEQFAVLEFQKAKVLKTEACRNAGSQQTSSARFEYTWLAERMGRGSSESSLKQGRMRSGDWRARQRLHRPQLTTAVLPIDVCLRRLASDRRPARHV